MPQSEPSINKPKDANWYPPWAPRFWHGMRIGDYFQLLKENRFRIHPARIPMATLITGCAAFNSSLAVLQKHFFDDRIKAARLKGPPVFIIGHWRSGTTLMHELISMDPRYAFPSNFDAFLPHHFLVSRSILYPLIKMLMPSKRPMDNMALNVSSPQEDDFALCAYGAPTPYRRIAFPNESNNDHLQLNFDSVDEETQAEVRQAMTRFLKTLTVRYGKPLVLKSPPHTGRLKQLAEWFPDAKFIHMSRDPDSLVLSTMRLWRLLDDVNGFQLPKYDDQQLKSYVFECKDQMYTSYFQNRDSLPSNRIAEVKFEDLVANPIATVGAVYDQLELHDFSDVRPKIESYFDQKRGHKKNKFSIDETLKQEIATRWGEYREAFGYE
jgi:hypothetical protein